jgi:hypothetical protein
MFQRPEIPNAELHGVVSIPSKIVAWRQPADSSLQSGVV